MTERIIGINQIKKHEWVIVWNGYADGYWNCESPSQSRAGSICGSRNRLLRLATQDGKNGRWVCAKHVKRDYKLVGEWVKTWELDFKLKDPNLMKTDPTNQLIEA